MPEFTHLDDKGRVRMVDVTEKVETIRMAKAQGIVFMNPDTLEKIRTQGIKKGNVLETARIAGVMAAKKTSELIPMCHPLNITHIQIDFFLETPKSAIRIEAVVRLSGVTGVEMEALTAVSV
ncbi:MAG: cyclic pyranopterin monophosphate synthase MoaC, partial [Desulfobacterales bacterium CG23_combo_of_CG06-09_8_20_14_all_52_9]